MNDAKLVWQYLDTFRRALRTLPAAKRDDAVREIESHLETAQAEGQSAAFVTS